jgi:hypothetical protein
MKTPTIQQAVDNQTLAIRSLRETVERQAQADELPPYHCTPNWRVALGRDRLLDPSVCLTTAFMPLLDATRQQVRCNCHGKPMLAFRSGDGSTVRQICTINAWFALTKQGLRYGKWRALPQSPTELYRQACAANNHK